MSPQRGFFDEQERLEKLSNQGDPLEKLNAMMDWKIFRPLLRRCFKKKPKGPGGRPPFDYVLMFKILILQRLYNLSDAQMQFQIVDRLSFQRFLGQGLHAEVPNDYLALSRGTEQAKVNRKAFHAVPRAFGEAGANRKQRQHR